MNFSLAKCKKTASGDWVVHPNAPFTPHHLGIGLGKSENSNITRDRAHKDDVRYSYEN